MILLNLTLLHHLFPQKSCSNVVLVQVIMNYLFSIFDKTVNGFCSA